MSATGRRRVVIDDKPKDKHRKHERHVDRDDLGIVRPSYESHTLAPPTGDPRHIGWIREGRMEGDVFSKARLATIPVDHDARSHLNAEAQKVKRTRVEPPKAKKARKPKEPSGAVADAVRRARERKREIK